jgi:coatomer subunit beta
MQKTRQTFIDWFIFQMVFVLKKAVVKTNNSVEHDDVGKYRQLLVRTLHQCSVKFPDVASSIIPVVSTQ